MLSNVDIIRELGKNIYIHPLGQKTIKGASINLTASDLAWSVITKKSIVSTIDGVQLITIPAHDTGLIETNESIYVSRKIGGTYHSRVCNVSLGAGHIGTTLNPGWIGRSMIAVHNHMDHSITIQVNEPFVTLVLYYLHNESSMNEDNLASRIDQFSRIGISLSHEEYIKIIESDLNKKECLLEEMKQNSIYIEKKKLHTFNKRDIPIVLMPIVSIILLLLLVFMDKNTEWYDIVKYSFIGYTPTMILAMITTFTRPK